MDASALLAMVHADPRDLAARAVYADALLEAGDPRGELIALQLERGRSNARPSRRELELLARWRDEWLGPLGDVIDERSRFANGFLRTVALRGGRAPMAPGVLAHAEWRTVEALDATALERDAALHGEAAELLERLPRLRALVAGPHAQRAIRARVRSHDLRRLELTSELQPVFDLLDAHTFPQLRALRLWCGRFEEPALLQLGTRVGTEVDLEVIAGSFHFELIARLIEGLVRKVRSFVVLSPWGAARATHTAGRIAIEPDDAEPLRAAAFRAILDRLGADQVVLRLRDRVPREAYGALAAAGFAIDFV